MPPLIVGIQFLERDFEHLDYVSPVVIWERIHESFELRE
jgi:hypothetical protein